MRDKDEDVKESSVLAPEDHTSHDSKVVGIDAHARRDAKVLVDRMVENGEWPSPELLQQIVYLGDAAVEPLHDFLRTMPREPLELCSLDHAIGLLGDLRRPESIPELIKIVENYDDDVCIKAASALKDFGTPGFEALVGLCTNQALSGTQRLVALDEATDSAVADPALRSRLGDGVRPILDHAIANVRAKRNSEKADVVPASREITIDNVAILVSVLARIADPLARDTIMMAFDEGLVDDLICTRQFVDKHYESPYRPFGEVTTQTWLDAYRTNYEFRTEEEGPPAPTPPKRAKYDYQDRYDEGEPPPGVPAIAPIRNTGPRTGRNDPCWCGSGKKYKKCHMGKEQTS